MTAGLVLHAGPALTAVAPLRRRLLPELSGIGRPGHVALTFDDGPDRHSTPRFLRRLDQAGVRATFFLLGTLLDRDPALGREITAGGHEVAVHGWEHRHLLGRTPPATYADIARARDRIAELTGETPRWYRPPYGVLTTAALLACARLGLQPRLWTAWGRDWTSQATGGSVCRAVLRTLRPGGTILLHDTDYAATAGSWRATLAALPELIDWAAERRLTLGPLRDHQPATVRTGAWPETVRLGRE
ncbi:polysaccharide deacetylase family protein [Micromonospora zingiberis]|uniref:Polysaccharide deacetylase family protein n=1 Tax=Micromonospora zingiberis TaxID=2053011 RepID=A0A4R0GBN7_9ACTN|nr:polysaccharide deacetylase family protein [Micromonospora zingiberis]TCB93453.1 polysaccharide deacetylase family protein [Micromonospora zingiberis]